ncbi:MAG: phenylalanine 4-monooxygenase [Bacteroidota bacterium]
MKPSIQIYDNYTQEDFLVWQTLFDRQMINLKDRVAPEFLESLEKVGFNRDEIPNFEKVNKVLQETTGWRIITVPNISPAKEFFQYLSNKEFTATCWLRKMEELDYLEEPDMFHDVFAHTPLLSNKAYTDFFHQMGVLACKYIDDDEVILKLQRLYWFTIEFGLIRSEKGLRIYGAGIISSKGETEHALGNASVKHDFNIHQIFDHDFRTDIIQEEYYVIDSFEQLAGSMEEIEAALFVPSLN